MSDQDMDARPLALGLALQQAGKHAEALTAFEQARAALAQSPWPLIHMSRSLLALERADAARAAAAQARALAPALADAHLAEADAFAALGAAQRAEAAYRTAMDLSPQSAEVWFRRGVARRRRGGEGARADFQTALRFGHPRAKAELDALRAAPVYAAWRPTDASSALGLAVEYLCQKPAFARLPFGEWGQTLIWQTARNHYVFALDGERRVVGFIGWALTQAPLAEAWMRGERGLSNDECLDGDCVIVNAWAADAHDVNAFLREAAARLFAGRSALYFKRHYPDGRERALRLPVPGHRRSPPRP